jgi:CheY-like chemotaxis protein
VHVLVHCDIAASASRPIPTVIMSASHERSSSAAAQRYGFTVLAKPINPEDLQAWLTDASALPE